MELRLKPETESRLNELAAQTGRSPNELIEDAMAGFFEELVSVQGTLDQRYAELKSGQVQAIDGEAFFEGLRPREASGPKHPKQ
jgi:predicted DNA-binding protein